MNELRYTLLSDGSSDRALMHVINWTIQQHAPAMAIQSAWADLRGLRQVPRKLEQRITVSIELYPCDVLFIHRDAEREPHAARVAEIDRALAQLAPDTIPPIVRVIPVRMQEAWLLFDEPALRRAAGNPSGQQRIDLPKLKTVEQLPDPKAILYDLLKCASGLKGRRGKGLAPNVLVHRVAELINDFSPLRQLAAFAALEQEVADVLGILFES